MGLLIAKMRRFIIYIIAIGLLISPIVFPVPASAASVTSFQDSMSTAQPSTAANHTISWVATDAIAAGDTITITFASAFDTSTIIEDDVDVSASTKGELTTAADCSGSEQVGVAMAADVLTLSPCATDFGADIGTTETVTVEIGSNATSSGTGSNKITSSTANSYTISLAGTGYTSTGSLQVAILAGVTTTVTVAASLSVAVAAKNTGTVNGASVTETNTTATAVDFSTSSMTVNTAKVAAQTITVSTNAAGGYSTYIKVQTSGASGSSDVLNDGGSNNCDGFTDSSATNNSPQAWADGTNPSGSSANVNTCWYGYNTSDTALSVVGDGAARFGSNEFAPFSVTAGEVAYDSVPVNAQTTDIGYKVEVNALQPRGTYTGTTDFITTAIF